MATTAILPCPAVENFGDEAKFAGRSFAVRLTGARRKYLHAVDSSNIQVK